MLQTASETTPASPLTLPTGPLAARAAAVFEETSPYDGEGFRNHCRRLFHLTELLLRKDDTPLDREVAFAVAMCHDLGIVSRVDTGRTYLERSRSLFDRELADFDMKGTPHDVLAECMVYNHRLLPVPGLSRQADAFRRAVQIEHTRGLLRFGLPREPVEQIFAAYPRGNFDRVLLDFTWRTLRREPLTIVNGIFF